MKQLKVFSDGSVNPQSKIGYGAYLVVSAVELPSANLQKQIRLKRFTDTSSTQLELQTLLWALDEISSNSAQITIYTDSQNIVELPNRRERFERNGYRTNKNTLVKNYKLYQEFFQITDKLNCELVKIKGHQPTKNKDKLDKIFTLVDRAARKALKNNKD